MNCIIVEDEQDATEYLEFQLKEIESNLDILARIPSVKKAVLWLKEHQTDLIFLDIQLADGLSFEIFDHIDITTPVIFTTSYNHYAIQAFELNSLFYLLKPITRSSLSTAIQKFNKLYPQQSYINDRIVSFQPDFQKRFFVQSGRSFKSIPAENISYFTISNGRYTTMVTKTGQQYIIENTLERLEQRLDTNLFFRINRQFIVNIDDILEMTAYDRGRIKIITKNECREEMIVAIHKVQAFKYWLNK
jgi:DNA-binding LytR/AlgR family response regulator